MLETEGLYPSGFAALAHFPATQEGEARIFWETGSGEGDDTGHESGSVAP